MTNSVVHPRVTLCVPHTEHMPSVFVHSLIGLLWKEYWLQQVSWGHGSDAAMARNFCVEQMPPETTDYYLFIDSDMGFPSNVLEQLLACDKPIVSALCFQKHDPYRPCVYRVDSLGQLEFLNNFPENELFWVDACGGALMLVKSEVFTKMSAYNPDWHKHWFAWSQSSEDITFCVRAKEVGFETWCDSRMVIDHFTMAPRGIENFRRKQEEIRKARNNSGKPYDMHGENKDGEYCWPDGTRFDYEKFRQEMIIPPFQQEKEAPDLGIDGQPKSIGVPDFKVKPGRDLHLNNLSSLRLRNNNHPQSAAVEQQQ